MFVPKVFSSAGSVLACNASKPAVFICLSQWKYSYCLISVQKRFELSPKWKCCNEEPVLGLADEVDMAVPLSPDELKRTCYAIFRHQSENDRAMFPGPYDSREFWQRAEERNMMTAEIYDALGLPEYHALEAFVRYPLRYSQHLLNQLEKEEVV